MLNIHGLGQGRWGVGGKGLPWDVGGVLGEEG